MKQQHWRAPCRWPHATWSRNGFQSPVHKEWGGIHFQVFSVRCRTSQEGTTLGVGHILLLSCVTYRHTAEPFRKNNLQKSCSYYFCFVKSHWLQVLVWGGDREENSFQARFRKIWKNTLLPCKLTRENDECQVENHQSQQQHNLSSVFLKSVFFAILVACCHFQDHCATLVSLPFRPHQSTYVCPRAAAGSLLDLQGIQPFTGALERAIRLLLVIVLQVFLGYLDLLFTTLRKLLRKKRNPIASCSAERLPSTGPPHQGATSCFHHLHP